MRIIELDASEWRTPLDFYNDLLPKLGAPKGHGENLNALIESMVWIRMNDVEPPYIVRIRDLVDRPKSVRNEVDLLIHHLAEARLDCLKMTGREIDVRVETVS